MIENHLFQKTLEEQQIGLWQLGDNLTPHQWSKQLLSLFDLNNDSTTPSIEYFTKNILHPNDIKSFEIDYSKYIEDDINFKSEVKLKNKKNQYATFSIFSTNEAPIAVNSDKKLIFFQRVNFIDKNPFSTNETSSIAKIGTWYVDFKNKISHWDSHAKKILGYPDSYTPSLARSADYYAPDHQQKAADLFLACSVSGNSFNTEIKMLTKNGDEIWVSSIGKAIRDEKNRIIGIKGVFQNINDTKKREIELKTSIEQISSQNDRLFNFAHIVSHNLRSHSSNLGLLVQVIESIDDPKEKLSFLNEVKTVSNSLSTTIEHLNEIVDIQANKKQEKSEVIFRNSFTTVKNSIYHIIKSSETNIIEDFSEKETIDYIPAYLESILLNLLTNAIKYKHPERNPEINIKTGLTVDKKTYLKFSDNGKGIDLKKFGKDIFGMYKTFHYNNDAVGIGLFITKNQIESLGGSIKIESTLEKGSTFTIIF